MTTGEEGTGWTAQHTAAAVADRPSEGGVDVRTAAVVATVPMRVEHPNGATQYLLANLDLGGVELAFDRGVSPLDVALHLGRAALADALLAAGGRTTGADAVGATPLHHAAAGGLAEATSTLLARGARPDRGTRVRRSVHFWDTGTTALHAACQAGSPAVVELLLDAGADPAARTATGCTAVFFAARGGSVPVLRLLTDRGLDPAAPVRYQDFPLDEAVRAGHLAMTEALLAAGSPTQEPQGSQAPMRHAVAAHRRDIVAALLAGGARPLEHASLHAAVWAADTDAVQQRLRAGESPDQVWDDETVLMRAAVEGDVVVVDLLLAAGADPNLRIGAGGALGLAVQHRRIEAARRLLAAGARPDLPDARGVTPLEWARRMCEVLVPELEADGGRSARSPFSRLLPRRRGRRGPRS